MIVREGNGYVEILYLLNLFTLTNGCVFLYIYKNVIDLLIRRDQFYLNCFIYIYIYLNILNNLC